MARIAVVTDNDTGLGFRLTGVDVFIASSDQESEMCIGRLLKNRDYGLVAYSEEYSESLPESLRIKMEESTFPVFIAIPSVKSLKATEREEEYVTRILQRALGFYIKLRK